MKTARTFALIAIALCIGVFAARWSESQPASKTSATESIANDDVAFHDQNKEFGSLCSVLAELAVQRYEEDSNSYNIPILTLQTNTFDIAKYTDGEYVVLSIAVISPDDLQGFCRFASDYNECNMRRSDLLVQGGKYEEARKLYQLLMHFDTCGFETDRLQERLLCLDKIEKREAVKKNMEIFSEPCGCGALTDWGKLAGMKPQTVTNLLMININ